MNCVRGFAGQAENATLIQSFRAPSRTRRPFSSANSDKLHLIVRQLPRSSRRRYESKMCQASAYINVAAWLISRASRARDRRLRARPRDSQAPQGPATDRTRLRPEYLGQIASPADDVRQDRKARSPDRNALGLARCLPCSNKEIPIRRCPIMSGTVALASRRAQELRSQARSITSPLNAT